MNKENPLQLNQFNQLTQDKKNTKKKEVSNKERINAILEKYNLKTPKKTQLIDKKKDFQIKPKPTTIEPVKQPPKPTTIEPVKQPQQLHQPQPKPQLSVNNLLNKDKQ